MSKSTAEKGNQDQQKTSRKKLIAKRWFYIGLYSVLAAAIVKILLMPLAAKALGLMAINSLVEIASLLLIAGASVVGIFWSLGLWRCSHPWPWNRAFRAHPPLWLAMVLGFVWVTLPYPDCLYTFLITTLLIIVFLALGQDQVSKPAKKPEFKGSNISLWSPEELLQWANEELPVQFDSQLLFGREKYAERIFNRLCSPQDDLTRKPKSLALLGELGSGKSSVIKVLVAAFKKNDWLVVEVDAWGREASNLDEQILELVIGELAKVVDVTGYKNIPSAYHDALKSHGGWWTTVSHLVNGQAKAKDKLKRIDDLLLIIGKQLLLVIEDPDRGVAADKEKRCQRIFSLFDRLQKLEGNRIKVVVTGAKDLLSGDLRVIEFKEELDDPAKAYADILNTFVNSIWNLKPMGKIWANGKPVFESLNFPFGTPRDFKHVIRDVDALWKKDGELCGEIDLKQLVLLSFLKQVSFRNPESQMFEYLKAWLNEQLLSSNRLHYIWGSDTAIFLPPRYDIVTSKNVPEKLSEKIWKRLSFDDQRAAEVVCSQVLDGGDVCTFQSVKCDGRVNYLKRFLSRSAQGVDSLDVDVNNLLPEEKLSDQTYLRAMANIYEALNSGNPLENKDVKKLIYAGQLSPYLYSRMRGEYRNEAKPLDPKCWSELANKIIELMPVLKFSPNDLDHPAGRHLVWIVSFLLNRKDGLLNESFERAGVEIALKALSAESQAGGDLLGLRDLNFTNYCWSRDPQTLWSFYRAAFNNPKLTPTVLKGTKESNSNFILGIANNAQIWIEKLKQHFSTEQVNPGQVDYSAVDNAVKLFTFLNRYFGADNGRSEWIRRLKKLKTLLKFKITINQQLRLPQKVKPVRRGSLISC